MANPTSLFISIGSHRASAARISLHGATLRVDAIADREFSIGQSSDLARAAQISTYIDELSAELGRKKGESVRVILSAQQVYTKWVSVPRLAGRSTEEIIELEARQEIPFPLESVCWSYWYAGEQADPSDEALVAAVRKELVDQISAAVEAVGLELSCIELSPFALKNAFEFNYPEAQGSTMIIDFGSRVCSLIFLEGEKFYLRTPSTGGLVLTTQLSRELGYDVTQAEQLKLERGVVGLAGYQVGEDEQQQGISKILRSGMTRLQTEITRTMSVWRSQQSGSDPAQVYLAGGSSALPYALEFFAEKITAPLEYFNAFARIEVADSIGEEKLAQLSYLYGDIIGSALSANALVDKKLEIVPESVTQKLEFKRKQPFYAASIALLLLGFGLLIGSNVQRKNKAEELLGNDEQKQREVAGYETQIKQLMTSSGKEKDYLDADDGHLKLERLAESYQSLVEKRSYWVSFLDDFNQRFDSQLVWITEWTPEYYFFDEKGKVVTDSGNVEKASPTAKIEAPARGSRTRKVPAIGAIKLSGLYRGDSRDVVFDKYNALRDESNPSEWLSFKDLAGNKIPLKTIDSWDANKGYGASFSVTIPLAKPLPVDPLFVFQGQK